MPDRSEGYDVAILGAGPTGCAIAYNLARRRVSPVVLDRGGAGGPHAVSGRIDVPWDAPEPYARLCLRSAERYPLLEEEIGAIESVRTGSLAPALTDEDAQAGMARAQRWAAAGLDVRWLPRDEALGVEPALSPQILGAVYSTTGGSVNPHLLVRRLMKAARQLGASFLLHCGYLAVHARPGGFLIRSRGGDIQAAHLVLAADVDDAEIRRQLDVGFPVRRVHDLMLVSDAMSPLLRHTFPRAHQRVSGEIVIEDPAPGGVAFDAIGRAAREVVRLLPSLAAARVLRACAGARADSIDGWPILGQAGDNLYIALAPHEIALCPLVGETLAEIITRRQVPDDIERFGPARFSASTASAGGERRQDSGRTP